MRIMIVKVLPVDVWYFDDHLHDDDNNDFGDDDNDDGGFDDEDDDDDADDDDDDDDDTKSKCGSCGSYATIGAVKDRRGNLPG